MNAPICEPDHDGLKMLTRRPPTVRTSLRVHVSTSAFSRLGRKRAVGTSPSTMNSRSTTVSL